MSVDSSVYPALSCQYSLQTFPTGIVEYQLVAIDEENDPVMFEIANGSSGSLTVGTVELSTTGL